VLGRVTRAGAWLLRSGIQEPDGGVARYYLVDQQRNLPVSTEITGYTVSSLVYLHEITRDERGAYLDRASSAARFLVSAWDANSRAMPFEVVGSPLTYFFDCGIIVRGLLSARRVLGGDEFLNTAIAVGKSMAADFAGEGDYHPILSLPDKKPAKRDPLSWSRSAGCYQLKSAMAWWDLWEVTGDGHFRELYDATLAASLRSYKTFLPGHPDAIKVMDRLHPFLYFLEGLLPRATQPRCAEALRAGIPVAAAHLREIAPRFERSDVYAQLLRVRLYADAAGIVPLDRDAAAREAAKLLTFQTTDSDPKVDGGFCFGRRGGECIPHVSPVSTSFALQALAIWDAHRAGEAMPHHHQLI
jgi:hypothetical protein